MRRAIITLLVLLSFGLKAQVYQAMPQAGYGPVKRMLFDSVLTIPLNINQLRNITGGRDAGQIRYNVTDSGLYVYSGYQWIKANLDSTNISNRINGKLNISDTAAMLLPYMKFIDTVSLSNRINLRVKYSDTAQMLSVYLRKLDTASLSRRIDKKQDSIILTTNFKSGAATLNGANLNIPKYSDTLSDAYVPYVGANKDVDLGVYDLTGTFLTANAGVEIQDNGAGIGDKVGYTSLYTSNEAFNFRTSRLLPNNLTKSRQATFLYPVEGDGYLTTFNYNLPVRNGTLALVEDTVNLSNRINLKADKATTLTINGVTYNLSANRSWTIPVFDSTSISNRIDLKLNISDTASMLSPYLRKADTSSLSNRIDLKLNATDTASLSNRINLKADKSTTLTINETSYDLSANRSWTIPTVDTTSLSNRINLKVNISDTAAMLNPYLRKVDTTNAFLTSVSQPNDSTLSFVKGSTLSSYIIRASTQGSATKLITNVYNNSGAPILKGSVVYINGAHSSNLPTIALALASNEATSAFTYGVVENDIPNNTAGVVVQNGVVTGLNLPTATYSDGQTLYLSPTVAGGYTLTKVIAPNHYVAVGTVTRAHPNFGTIQVAIRNGFQLDELSDVLIAAVPLDSTVLQFSRVDSLWHDVSITNAIGSKYIKPTDTTSLSNRINAKADALSGTTNTVPKFTSSTTIGNSNIKDDGNVVTVNATAGNFGALQVGSYNGNILMNTTNSNGGLIFQNTSSSNKLWDFSSDNNDLVFNESNIAPVMKLKAGGNVQIYNLSGTGTRMVVADANGILSSQAISNDTTSLSNRINLKLNISDTASMLSGYQSAINSKQAQINGTGFVKASGTTISYDNSSYYLASNPNGYTSNTGTVTSVASGLGLSGGTITTSGTLLVDTASASILSRQRAANTYYLASNPNGYTSNTGTVTSVATGLGLSGGTISTSGTLLVDTSSASILSRQRAANTYATTSSLSGYLPLTGGTLTGALGGTSASFSSTLQATGLTATSAYSYLYGLRISGNDVGNTIYQATGALGISTGSSAITFNPSLTTALTLASTGAATFSSSVTATKAILGASSATSSVANLEVFGSTQVSTNNGQIRINDLVTTSKTMSLGVDGTNNVGFIQSFQDGVAYRSLILNGLGGNVGIGTASPSYLLHLYKASEPEVVLQNTAATWRTGINSSNEYFIYSGNAYAMYFATSGSERMRITSGGNVGIGTTSPSAKLDVVGDIRIRRTADPTQYMDIFPSGGEGYIDAINSASATAQTLIFRRANNVGYYESMRITSGGNIIGKIDFSSGTSYNTPTAYKINEDNNWSFGSFNSGSQYWMQSQFNGDGSENRGFRVLNNATSTVVFKVSSSGTATISSLGTGVVYSLSGTLTGTNPSDSSLKNSIAPLSYGLSEILQLQPKTFYYNSDSTKASLKYGFIAQDVQPIMPDLVRTIGNGSDKLGLESDGIYVTMVNAIKELSAQIKELQTKIQTLENK